MSKSQIETEQLHELLYQALETEQGGIKVYENAIECAINPDLKKEWTEYLDETRNHEQVLLKVFADLGLDPEVRTPGRDVVGHIGESLVAAMQMAKQGPDPRGAELVACECVVLAETKDHQNWELIGHVAKKTRGLEAKVLMAAYEQVEDQEDHHLYHTRGWCREMWIDSLGLPAVLPPPEEVKKVETAIGAARAEQQRGTMM